VKVNAPDAEDWGDDRFTVPELFVLPDTAPLTTPLHEPVTVAPEIGFPARSFIVTAAVAETAVEELLEERAMEFT